MQALADQERINRNVNELSAKLLEGYKLLSESCPETNVPLVLSKDGRMFSVGNQQYYTRENGKLVVEAAAPAVQPASAHYEPSGPAHGASTPALRGLAGSFYAAAPPERADASPGSLSQRVAAKLLDGWQLLSESCPQTNVPLVQSREGQILSVGTGEYYTRGPTGALTEASASVARPPPPLTHSQLLSASARADVVSPEPSRHVYKPPTFALSSGALSTLAPAPPVAPPRPNAPAGGQRSHTLSKTLVRERGARRVARGTEARHAHNLLTRPSTHVSLVLPLRRTRSTTSSTRRNRCSRKCRLPTSGACARSSSRYRRSRQRSPSCRRCKANLAQARCWRCGTPLGERLSWWVLSVIGHDDRH
jgi:uncharacterized Zn finger protein (UPF0148 family)